MLEVKSELDFDKIVSHLLPVEQRVVKDQGTTEEVNTVSWWTIAERILKAIAVYSVFPSAQGQSSHKL